MKKTEQTKARELRQAGMGVVEISKQIDATQSSVSLWVRDIKLTIDQQISLKKKNKESKRKAAEIRCKVESVATGRLSVKRQSRVTSHPKELGEISEARVLAEFIEAGISVAVPWGDNDRYDLVIEDQEGKLLKVQIKTARLIQGGRAMEFPTKSVNYWNHDEKSTRNYKGQIDMFAAYSPDTKKVYVLRIDDAPASTCTLRLAPTLKNQVTKLRWAEDHEFKGILPA